MEEHRGFRRFRSLERRTTIAITVQILSHVLGVIQIQVLCAILRCSFRTIIATRPFSLDAARFVDAASTPIIAWHARWTLFFPSVLFVCASLIPAAVWSGALTPVVAESQTARTLQIPTFETGNLSMMWDGPYLYMKDQGASTFYLVEQNVKSKLQASASAASKTIYTGGLHAKMDLTGCSYVNRSFGVGAGAGLIDIPDTQDAQWYSYHEVGFRSDVSCRYNQSSRYGFKVSSRLILRIMDPDSGKLGDKSMILFYPTGFDAALSWPQIVMKPDDVFIWSAHYAGNASLFSIATGGSATFDQRAFAAFNATQCQVTFHPRNFSVFVNNTAKTVRVQDGSSAPWPDYGDTVLDGMIRQFTLISLEDSFIGGSALGQSVVLNRDELGNLTGIAGNATLLRSLEDYISFFIDDSLSLLSATELMGKNQTVPVTLVVGLRAVVYGESKYVYAAMAINGIILVIFGIEALRTGLWKGMVRLDLTDVASVMISTSKGGTQLVEKVREVSSKEQEASGVGRLKVRLVDGNGGVEAIVPVKRRLGLEIELTEVVPEHPK